MQHSLQSKRRRKKKLKIKPFRSERELPNSTPSIPQEYASAARSIVAKSDIKPSAENREKILSSPDLISIKGLTTSVAVEHRTKNEISEALKEEKAERDYTIDEISIAWSAFTEQKLVLNRQVQAVFALAKLELKESNLLEICVPSETQQMYFNDYRADLGDFLRKEFGIRGLQMEVVIDKSIESKSSGVIITDKDRFEAMREKNPILDELRKKFNLQIDF